MIIRKKKLKLNFNNIKIYILKNHHNSALTNLLLFLYHLTYLKLTF
jgi:hypothetical protein